MDPDACMERLIRALERRDFSEARWALSDLTGWLDKGGFPPRESSIPVPAKAPTALRQGIRNMVRRLEAMPARKES